MAVRKLKDDEGKTYDVEIPDDDEKDDEGDDDETIYLDEEDVEGLRRKRREESEASRTSQTKKETTKTSDKVVKIRAKQQAPSTDSRSAKSRVRTLRLA
jgi:hypothetical protein